MTKRTSRHPLDMPDDDKYARLVLDAWSMARKAGISPHAFILDVCMAVDLAETMWGDDKEIAE